MRFRHSVSTSILILSLLGLFSVVIPAFAQQTQEHPQVLGSTPPHAATNIPLNVSITAAPLYLPNGGLDDSTVTPDTVYLYPTGAANPFASRVAVSSVNATGGGDAITLTPAALLQPNTSYTFVITDAVKDGFNNTGVSIIPFQMSFTTGSASGGGGNPSDVEFTKVASGASTDLGNTSLAVGPDGRLYSVTNSGHIYRWDILPNGALTNQTELLTSSDQAPFAGRVLIGLDFDPASTPQNPILWVSHNQGGLSGGDHFTGAIAKLTVTGLGTPAEAWTRQDQIIGLPRSLKDHLTNSLAFGPDGALYVTQGSISAMGERDDAWGQEPETLLSAAVLRIDTQLLAQLGNQLPLNVTTGTATGDPDDPVGTDLQDQYNYGFGDPELDTLYYNPQAPDAPLTIFGSGVRNAYDLVWHTNGQLYVPTNGSAGNGIAPATRNPLPESCKHRVDDALYGDYTGPTVPQAQPDTQNDFLFRVVEGGYYGHPNPKRCEWVLNSGNPTAGGYNDTGETLTRYPTGTQPDRNYRGFAYNFGLNKSANGVIEYLNNARFDGTLSGQLLVIRYSGGDDILVLEPGGPTLDIVDVNLGMGTGNTIPGFGGFNNPLDLAENPATGHIYVIEYAKGYDTKITLLVPTETTTEPNIVLNDTTLIYEGVVGAGVGTAQPVTISNNGTASLSINELTMIGAGAVDFQISAPPTPYTILPGTSSTVNVSFNPKNAGVRVAYLQIRSNDPDTPTDATSIEVRGLGKLGTGGSNEPSLQWILDTFAIPVNVGDNNASTAVIHDTNFDADLLGEEVAAPSFTKAGSGNVTVQPLAVFGPTTNNPVVAVGWYQTGNSGSTQELFTVSNSPTSNGQRLNPPVTGQISFNPGAAAFGFYSRWPFFSNRQLFSEDALNTFNGAIPHHVRVYPYKDRSGVIVPDTYIVTTEEHTSGFDYQDVVLLVSNVMIAAPPAPELVVSAEEMIFSAIEGSNGEPQTISLTNNGTAALSIQSIDFGGTHSAEFAVHSAPSLPFSLGIGQSQAIQIKFTPRDEIGPLEAQLQINGTATTNLYGLSAAGSGGNDEPPLNSVVTTLGYAIDVGGTQLLLGTDPAPIGDEVEVPLFQKIGTNPVTMQPVARYSPREALPYGYYTVENDAPVTTVVGTLSDGVGIPQQHQVLNPLIASGGTTFDPGGDYFGVFVDSTYFGRKSYSQDEFNTGIPHAVRVYPLKDRTGQPVRNSYLVVFEDATNGDYQDYVFVLSNVEPAGTITFAAKINFQNPGAAVPTGYIRDFGQPYGLRTSTNQGTNMVYGWIRQDSVGTGSPVPLDLSIGGTAGPGNGRDRNISGVPQELDTTFHMQYGDVSNGNGTNGVTTPGAWEIQVPNGQYDVTVALGDATTVSSGDPESYDLSLEGVKVINDFVPSGSAGAASQHTIITESVTVTDGRLTVDAIGGTNTKINYIVIVSAGGIAPDTTPPMVDAQPDGVTQGAATYVNQVSITVTASDTGSGIATVEYSLNGGAYQPYTTPVLVSGEGEYTFQARATDIAGNSTTGSALTFNVIELSGGTVRLENLDWVQLFANADLLELAYLNEWLTLSRISGGVSNHKFHDKATLRIHNDDTEALIITALEISGPFGLVGAPTLPLSINGGSFYDLTVSFTENTGTKGIRPGTLTIFSSDAATPQKLVQLRGGYMTLPESPNEINFNQIAQAFGFGVNIGNTLSSAYQVAGDEVLSYYWVRTDTSQQVYARQLAAYHGCFNTAYMGLYGGGGGTMTHLGVDCQTLLPRSTNTNNPPTEMALNFTATQGRIEAAGYVSNDCEGITNCNEHGIRLWPIYNPDGELVPNTYYVIQDYVQGGCAGGSANCDYNDNVFLITNIQPINTTTNITVSATGPAETVAVNTPVTYTVQISNPTVFTAKNVSLTAELPDFTGLSAITQSGTCTVNGSTLSCTNLGPLDGKRSLFIDVSATPTLAGTRSATFTAATTTPESATADNTVMEDITVDDPNNIPGTLTVILNATPDDDQAFSFGLIGNGADESFDLVDNGSTQTSHQTLAVNFQSQSAAVPQGYLRDYGQPYGPRSSADQGTGLTYGWITQATVGTANPTPLDLTNNGRDRNRTSDQRVDTLLHMQYGDIPNGSNGNPTPGAWEIALENGQYEVTITMGEIAVQSDAAFHSINVEGTNLINRFESTGASGATTRYTTATMIVEVQDGKLTLDAIGGQNSKINYVEITPVVSANTYTIPNLFAGDYTLTQLTPAGWQLNGVVCSGDDGTSTLTNGVVVTLPVSADVTCTFNNSTEATNLPPVANNDTADMFTSDGSVTFNIVANDSDPENGLNIASIDLDPDDDSTNAHSYSVTNQGDFTYNATTGEVTFTPVDGFTGIVSIVYDIEDNEGVDSEQATITVTVTQPTTDNPPTAANDEGQVLAGEDITIPVLANDTDDTGLDAASVTIVTEPTQGSVSVNPATGAVIYSANANASGQDSFTYTVDDTSEQTSNIATVTLYITGTDAVLVGSFSIQARAEDAAGLSVKLYQVGADTPAYEFTPTAGSNGQFTLTGITPGTYEIKVKATNTLQVVEQITLIGGANSADFGELPTGDVNNDNRINAQDFSLLTGAFNTASGHPNYNPAADFNADGYVNAQDFSILTGNFNTSGEFPSGITP